MATPLVGWASDRWGSRNVFLWAVGTFLLSSMLCGAASSLTEMVCFRIAQGIAAAFIAPMSQTIVMDVNPPSKQGSAMSVWAAIIMVAPICGPMVGGLLTDTLNWRWVFYINVPIGIPTFLIFVWLLPARPSVTRKLDLFGFVALAIGLGCLQLVLDRGQHKDWFSSREIVIETIIALSAFWIFAVHARTTKNALIPGELFRSPNFAAVFMFMFVLGVANVAVASVLPTMYQTVFGYTAFDTGMLMMPRGMGVVITMVIVGRLMGKVDVRHLITVGYMIAGGAMWYMSQWSLDMDRWPILKTGFIQGLGLGLVFVPLNMAALSAVKHELRQDASSVMNLMRNLGGSFGISIFITMLSRNTQTSHSDLASHITAFNLPSIDLSSTTERFAEFGASIMYAIDAEINRQALMIAYLDNFYVMSFFILFITIMPFLMKPIRIHSSHPS